MLSRFVNMCSTLNLVIGMEIQVVITNAGQFYYLDISIDLIN